MKDQYLEFMWSGATGFFMVLQGNEYAITKAYQAVDEDIFDIVKLLKHLKIIIEEYNKQS